MLARLLMGLALAMGVGVLLGQPAVAKDTTVDAALMKTLDPDGDGTVDLAEAKAAGAAMFKKLNTDDDDTLDMKELGGRVSEADFKAADPDGDGTLDEGRVRGARREAVQSGRSRRRRHAGRGRAQVAGGPEALGADRLMAAVPHAKVSDPAGLTPFFCAAASRRDPPRTGQRVLEIVAIRCGTADGAVRGRWVLVAERLERQTRAGSTPRL